MKASSLASPLVALLGALLLAGCAKDGAVDAEKPSPASAKQTPATQKSDSAKRLVPDITVGELEQLLGSDQKHVLLDANSAETRAEFGVIPGAKLLSSYRNYDVANTLPADKSEQLVFYCSTTTCSAAPKAAKRAMEAGYTNVSHLSVGIKGWVAAGKKTEKAAQAG